MRRRRILLGMTEVAGYFGNLERGLRSIGMDADFIDRSEDAFQYRRPGFSQRIANAARRARNRAATRPSAPTARAWRLVLGPVRTIRQLAHSWLFVRAILHYDAFIFNWGDTLLPRNLDLPILKRLGKRVVWVFLGSDHRPAYLSGGAARADGPHGIAAVITESRRRKARVELAERYADWIVALPASAHFHSRPFVNFLRVGIPFAAADDEPETEIRAHPFAGSGVRILHAPSDPLFKGTPAIRRCIEGLRAEGHAIDYAEVTRRPHDEVVDAIRACDLVVDSVYSDTPMAVLATEAAFFGKPAVVTGYFAACIREELPSELIPPTAFDVPEQLIATVRRLVVDERQRRELGERARRFVREYWAPERVAERFMRLMDDDVPPEWVVRPADLRYVHGWGLSEVDARAAIRAVLQAGGPASLLLDHEPPVRDRVIRFAESGGKAL